MPLDDIPLSDGHRLPGIGLGTYSLDGDAGADAVAAAIGSGYRLLDTALGYGNEDAVGEGVRRSGLPRDEIIVTSKVPEEDHGYDATLRSIETSLANLGLERIDLYLIHWPVPEKDLYAESWAAMIEARNDGRLVSIGVSNFDRAQLERLRDETGELPVLNQVELHLGLPQEELRATHDELGVVTEAYSPLKGPDHWREHPAVRAAAEAHGATPNQIALRWAIQLGTLPIPRSKDTERQRENLGVDAFELTAEQMERLTAIR